MCVISYLCYMDDKKNMEHDKCNINLNTKTR